MTQQEASEQEKFNAWWDLKGTNSVILRAQAWSAWLARAEAGQPQPAEDPQPVEVTDRRGVVLVPGQKLFVLQTEQTRLATVVKVTESRSSSGWWVDVDLGHGPEGVPSDILEVCNAPPQPEDPDEWVEITDKNHVIRKCDQLSDYGTQWYPPSDFTRAVGKTLANCGFAKVRCRRRDLPQLQPQPQKTRVRVFATFGALHLRMPGEVTEGIGREVKHDAEGFYVER